MSAEAYRRWHVWEAREVDIADVVLHRGALTVEVVLLPERSRRQVVFSTPLAVRFSDEGKRLRTIDAARWEGGPAIYRVDDSEFSGWFIAEASGTVERDAITHYAVVTQSGLWVDVISIATPEIRDLPSA